MNEIVSTLAENGCEQSLRLLRVGGGTRTGGGAGGGGSESGKCVELCEQKRAECVGGTRARDAGRGTAA